MYIFVLVCLCVILYFTCRKKEDTIMNIIHYPKTLTELQNIVRQYNNITVVGTNHSQAGQTISENIVNMKYLNSILEVDIKNNTVTVEAGLTWHGLIKELNKYGFSPRILQSYSTFSIGGSISVNAHGIINDDVVGESIVNLTIIDSLGEIKTYEKNSYIASLIIGGYGLFGIIYKVTLEIIPNTRLTLQVFDTNIRDFYTTWNLVTYDKKVKLARINLLDFNKIKICTYDEEKKNNIYISKLLEKKEDQSRLYKIFYKWIYPFHIGKYIRSCIEDYSSKPYDLPEHTTLNELISSDTDSVYDVYSPFITLRIKHVLQEYFVSKLEITEWLINVQHYFHTNKFSDLSLLNITIRVVNTDKVSFLKYARQDCYAIVFYYRINDNESGNLQLDIIAKNLIQITQLFDGSFYLPYKINYTKTQLLKSYPNIKDAFTMKYILDHKGKFDSVWSRDIQSLLKQK